MRHRPVDAIPSFTRGVPLSMLVAFLLLLLGWTPAQAATAAEDATSALAHRYAPLVVVRSQPRPCGPGEPFQPSAVGTVLGAPGVVLRGPNGAVIDAPTAADLAGKGPGWYLDLPGDPLAPRCDYEQWARARSSASPPTVYARVATDPDDSGELALQYWFFYPFNDWNDKHESDWEMIQLVFPAATPQEALSVSPVRAAYAQHEGAQVSPWVDGDLVRVGDHPVVYPGEGSHAAYFAQRTWFGRSAQAGFGCDDTSAPGTRLTPEVVVLPTGAPQSGPFAWLSFTGRWGQHEASFNNGPTGPATKRQWTQPIQWMEQEGRTSAVALPPVPSPALRAFCRVTASASLLAVDMLDQPWLVAGILLALMALIGWLLSRTRWRHADADQPTRRRRAGQILTAAFGWSRRHALSVAGMSGTLLLAGLVSRAVQTVAMPPPDRADITGTASSPGWLAGIVLLGLVVAVVALVSWVATATIQLVADDAQGAAVTARRALAQAAQSRSGIAASAGLLLTATVLTASVVLLPVAALLLARWAVAPGIAVVEQTSLRAALRRSAGLTRGARWRTLLIAGALLLVGLSLAGLLGSGLLLAGLPLWVGGLVSLVLLAVLEPIAFVGIALLTFDLVGREPGQDAPVADQLDRRGL